MVPWYRGTVVIGHGHGQVSACVVSRPIFFSPITNYTITELQSFRYQTETERGGERECGAVVCHTVVRMLIFWFSQVTARATARRQKTSNELFCRRAHVRIRVRVRIKKKKFLSN